MQKAFLRSEEDQRAGRDPSTFAGHTIEFCLASGGDCTGRRGTNSWQTGRRGKLGLWVGAGAAFAAGAVLAGLGFAGMV